MNFLIGCYLGVLIVWIVSISLNRDIRNHYSFFPLLGVILATGILWPFTLGYAFIMAYIDDQKNKKEAIQKKENILHGYLFGYKRELDRKFLYEYMKEHFPEGILAINNHRVCRTEFAFLIESKVKHPVEPLGFHRGATEWYTKP